MHEGIAALARDTIDIRQRIDARLAELIPDEHTPPCRLHRAMRHSLLAPGKRIRPVVTALTTEALGGDVRLAVDPGCAIEMVHTASLVLDDLPFMDDAEVRRGRESCHRAFGVDMATLAAVSLLNRAFGVLAEAPGLDPSLRLELIGVVSSMIGDDGIVAGQVRDLHHAERRKMDPSQLERMAREKTGALFVASAESGARIAGASADTLESIRAFAWNFGLYFQVLDDLVDLNACPNTARKDVGQDRRKQTFATLLGPDRARECAETYRDSAMAALERIGPNTAPLGRLAGAMLESPAARR